MLKHAKVVEGQDAVFEGVFSGPVPQITWCANDISIEHGDKYNITVSEDKLTHRLLVKNCKKEDKGVYTAIAGIKSSRATLAVDGKSSRRTKKHNISAYFYTAMYLKQANNILLFAMLYAISEDPNAKGKGQGGANDGADDLARRLADEQARLQREKDEAARRGKGTHGRGDGADGRGGAVDGRGDGADGHGGLGGDGRDGCGRDATGKYGQGGLGGLDGSGGNRIGGDVTGKYRQGGDGKDGSGKGGKDSGMGLGADGLGGQSAGVESGGDGTGMLMTKL